MKITLDKVVAGAEGSLGGRDPGLSGIPASEGCSLSRTISNSIFSSAGQSFCKCQSTVGGSTIDYSRL